MRVKDLQFVYIYIKGVFSNITVIGSGFGSKSWAGSLIKPKTRFGFFLNPYPTLLIIGPGKTRPIRVGPGRVPTGRAEIVIPNNEHFLHL